MATKKTSRQENISDLSFEQALERLGAIVTDIEQGKIALEESIRQYELGCNLIQHCRKILDQAERKVQMLSKTTAGKLEAASADLSEEQGQAKPSDEDQR